MFSRVAAPTDGSGSPRQPHWWTRLSRNVARKVTSSKLQLKLIGHVVLLQRRQLSSKCREIQYRRELLGDCEVNFRPNERRALHECAWQFSVDHCVSVGLLRKKKTAFYARWTTTTFCACCLSVTWLPLPFVGGLVVEDQQNGLRVVYSYGVEPRGKYNDQNQKGRLKFTTHCIHFCRCPHVRETWRKKTTRKT